MATWLPLNLLTPIRLLRAMLPRMVERSAAAALFDSGHFGDVEIGPIMRVSPDELAESVFEMATTDVAVERVA
ncbi:hypothetical protein ACIP5Y_12165 [Nocardia sp. NPDC088792]|uniref:hypothetical protein n=1 Tax=Nocardia sp. NPDC088792 TaxID=3364332 RepID=UPI00380C8F14